MVAPAYMDYVMNGSVAGPMSNRHPLGAAAPHSVFPCAGDDGWISIAVMEDEEWRGLVKAMGEPQWAMVDDPATMAGRVAQIEALHEKSSEWTRGFDKAKLAEQLQEHGVAAAPVLQEPDLFDARHYQERGTFVDVEHPIGFKETIYGSHVKMTGAHPDIQPGPMMGCDNEYVFKELTGICETRYRALVEDEIIF
jgi:benzylsuccinate CoA-transferase BbsF subunit